MDPQAETWRQIRALVTGSWDEPRRAASSIVALLPRAGRPEQVADLLRRSRPDQAIALWLGSELDDGAWGRAERALEDTTWRDEVAARLTEVETVGVASLGTDTFHVIRELAAANEQVTVVTTKASVALAMHTLDVPVRNGRPWRCDVALVPTAAAGPGGVWTSNDGGQLLDRSPRPVLLTDPLAVLDPTWAGAYRPPEWLRLVALQHTRDR
jgi:hypothetical protein